MRPVVPFFLSAALFAIAPAWAQAPADAETLPDVPPPPADIRPFDDSIEEPQVTITIRREERGTVEEYRIGGKLYMLKITPDAGAPYYLVDSDGDGHFETHSPTDSSARVPMWVIGTF
ncbi:MAG: DUF2782 domain-containing protein [Zoogloeaceae bacterium]|jgi:hypothetical protein|nr:DUF2782 domain-containing protein [Zoogloeaceae bacterium]